MSYLSGKTANPLSGLLGGVLSGYDTSPQYRNFPIATDPNTSQSWFIRNLVASPTTDGVGAGGNSHPYLDPNWTNLAAAGDIPCEGFYGSGCSSGGDSGTTAMYGVFGRKVCRKCAVKMLGISDDTSKEQLKVLTPRLLGGGK
jgi:hypothetical protein